MKSPGLSLKEIEQVRTFVARGKVGFCPGWSLEDWLAVADNERHRRIMAERELEKVCSEKVVIRTEERRCCCRSWRPPTSKSGSKTKSHW